MRFIELLRSGQRLFGGKAKLGVCFALQGCQIIKQRRPFGLMLTRSLGNHALHAAHARSNGFRHLPLIDALFPFRGNIHALIITKVCADGIVRLRNKGIDFLPALDEHRQRRRLHAPDGQKYVIPECIGARSVHADEPVRIRPAARTGIKSIIIRRRAQGFKPCADRLVGHRRNP